MPAQPCDRTTDDARLTLVAEPQDDAMHTLPIVLRCRMFNGAQLALDGAVLRFVLPSEVEVPAGEPAAILLAELPPDGQSTVIRTVTVHPSIVTGTELRFEAVLSLPNGRRYQSNAAIVKVRRRVRLDGPETGVRVLPTELPREIIVEARLVNAGALTAHDIVLNVPLPAGTRAVDPLGATEFALARLEPGEAHVFAYRAQIIASALRRVRATDASIRTRAGERYALAPSEPLALHAMLSEPQLHVVRAGRRLHVTVRGENLGGACADDVEFALHWPAAFSCSFTSFAWNGARVADFDAAHGAARARVNARGAVVRVPSIDAGQAYALAFDLNATPIARTGMFELELRTLQTTLRAVMVLDWTPRSDIRLRIVTQPDEHIDIGTRACVVIELFNAGDNDSSVQLEVDGPAAHLSLDDRNGTYDHAGGIALAAGDCRLVYIDVEIPQSMLDGERLALGLIISEQSVEVARAQIPMIARNRVWLDTRNWLTDQAGNAVIELANTGSTTARNVVLVCADGTCIEIGDIAAQSLSRTSLGGLDITRVTPATLSADGQPAMHLAPTTPDSYTAAHVDAIVRVSAPATAGAPQCVTLHIVCAQSTSALAIRLLALDQYIPLTGSLRIDGHTPAGDLGELRIDAPEGVVLHSIVAGTHIELTWNVRAAGTGVRPLGVELEAAGVRKRVYSQLQTLDIEPAAAGFFAKRASVRLCLPLERTRIQTCLRLLSGTAGTGAVARLNLLRGFFPTDVHGGDSGCTAALHAARAALEDLHDRLRMKLRMPGFEPTVRDCADMPMRRAVQGLLTAVTRGTAKDCRSQDAAFVDGAPVGLTITIEADRAQQHLLRLIQNPADDRVTLGTMLEFVRFSGLDSALERALQEYIASVGATPFEALAGRAEGALSVCKVAQDRLVEALVEVQEQVAVRMSAG